MDAVTPTAMAASHGAVRALSALAGVAVALGPTLGFLIQAREIQTSGKLKGFSTWVCLLLFTAHLLRVFFW